MHAACSQEGRHTQRPGLPSVSPAPGQPPHAHKTGVRTQAPACENRGSGPLPGKAPRRACSWERQPEVGAGGGRKAANRVAQTDNNKDGNGDFQRRSGCTQLGALTWLHLLPGNAWSPGGIIAILKSWGDLALGWLGSPGQWNSGGDALENNSGLTAMKGLVVLIRRCALGKMLGVS